jgi:hypothetical protein
MIDSFDDIQIEEMEDSVHILSDSELVDLFESESQNYSIDNHGHSYYWNDFNEINEDDVPF